MLPNADIVFDRFIDDAELLHLNQKREMAKNLKLVKTAHNEEKRMLKGTFVPPAEKRCEAG